MREIHPAGHIEVATERRVAVSAALPDPARPTRAAPGGPSFEGTPGDEAAGHWHVARRVEGPQRPGTACDRGQISGGIIRCCQVRGIAP